MIINFAKDQGFKTIAEFVSSKEILEKVKYLGVDYVQGYYIHEPSDKIED
jgi:EAL domain-containing protein (putative c-di-GMP-specific phosphodiesterase class I)